LPAVHPRRRRRGEDEPPPEPASPYRGVIDWFSGGKRLELSDSLNAPDHYEQLKQVPGLAGLAREYLHPADELEMGAAMEFVLEGLHQSSVLAKEDLEGRKIFLDMFQTMFSSLEDS
jgi:magnesium chelatase subunit I